MLQRCFFSRQDAFSTEDMEAGVAPCREHGDHLLRDLSLVQKHPEHLVPEDGPQFFQLQGRGDAEHALVAVETAVRHEDVGVRIESEKVAEGMHSDDGAGDGIRGHLGARCPHCLPEKDLQGFPGAAAEIGKKLPILEKVTAQDLRDAEYEMTVRDLLENIHAEPFWFILLLLTANHAQFWSTLVDRKTLLGPGGDTTREVGDMGVAHILECCGCQWRPVAGCAIENDPFSRVEHLVMVGVGGVGKELQHSAGDVH